ncbi:molybdenum cofactor guanylyltransferase [Psychromonas sp. RZ22]|uniref:molybdenum cofactor guanylyltransferase n=1 Tax=Psychromonas algarum TaxID=2555643 RepID=UPI0010674732|nr:molybdenum cofactor guanylyltransferase [Psychromonas sp. RZ22]TEW56070.1 molybdenum cofactor guanylyltransferase [Psychromonas sp. RZ22]
MKIAGVVLAGGQSLRMGKDKATLTLEQHTLLSRAVTLLQNAGVNDCFVSGDYEGFNCISDQYSSLGPIAGLDACATQLSTHYDAMLIIPVDMPLLAVEDCQHILQQFTSLEIQGVYYQDVTFPMLLTLNDNLTGYLSDAVTSSYKKHRSLYRLLKQLKVKGICKNERDAFRFENTNTPEQWQHCLSTYAMMQSKD